MRLCDTLRRSMAIRTLMGRQRKPTAPPVPEPTPASRESVATAGLRAEVAKQQLRLAKDRLKRARKQFKDARREAKHLRKRSVAELRAWKRIKRAARAQERAAARAAKPKRRKRVARRKRGK